MSVDQVAVGSVVEILFPGTDAYKRGTVTEQVAGNYTFRIKMDDDGFDEPLSYSLEKYVWRFPSSAEALGAIEEATPQEEVYEVEAITDKRRDEEGTLLYKVKWKGYAEEESTWEPMEHLESAKNLVDEFNKAEEEKKKKKAARKRQRKTDQPPPRKRAKIEPGTQQYSGGPTFWPVLPIQTHLDINDCHNWNEEDISQWLNVFDFGSIYRQKFLDNAVDGRLLLEITFPTLFEELEITDDGHKHQFKTAITVLKQARQIKYGDEN